MFLMKLIYSQVDVSVNCVISSVLMCDLAQERARELAQGMQSQSVTDKQESLDA